MLNNYLVFSVAFLAAAVNAWPIYRLLIALKSRQNVSSYAPEAHQLKQGTPTMGGLIIAIGFLTGAFAYGLVFTSGRSLAISLLFIGFAIIGFVDDFVVPRMIAGKRGLGWKQKISMQLVVALGCAWWLIGDFSGATFATVFLILFFSNAYNFADGLDALAGSLLLVLGGGLAAISNIRHADHLTPFFWALLGSVLPFLYLNKPKAKLFMGDVGSLPVGAVLGIAVSVLLFPNDFDFLYAAIPSMGVSGSNLSTYMRPIPEWQVCAGLLVISGMMFVELIPVPLQILSVKVRKKKLFSFTPIHHAYERRGWPELKVVLVFVAWQCAMSVIAVALISDAPVQDAVFRDIHEKENPNLKWHTVKPGGH